MSHLGYMRFPGHLVNNRFFESFISGFKTLNGGAVRAFTPLQQDMLDQLIAGNHFQVSSADVNCGSGKTTLTVGGTIGMLGDHDRMVVVTRPSKDTTPLLSQLKQLSATFSRGSARVGTFDNSSNSKEFVRHHDILVSSCVHFFDVARLVIDYFAEVSFGGEFRAVPKVYIIFDESHQLFGYMPRRTLDTFFGVDGCGPSPASAEADMLYRRWLVTEDMKLFHKRLSTATRLNASQRVITIRSLMGGRPKPFLFNVQRGLAYLHLHRRMGLHQCIFLSAGGEFVPGSDYVPPSAVIKRLMGSWFDVPVTKLLDGGANVDSFRQTKIFRIFRSGAEQVGGVSPQGYPLVYEAMMNIAFNWLIEGRLLFIMRRSQVDTFSELLNARIMEFGSYYSYTADKDYWNAVDSSNNPKFNIVICREDELNLLEGVNLLGIKAVYLFSIGRVSELLNKLQGIGRVGRIGQGRTYTFVMVDCATKANAKTEAYTEDALLHSLSSNSVYKPHIVDVLGAKVLSSTLTDIAVFRPTKGCWGNNPLSGERLRDLMSSISAANRRPVCRSLFYDTKTESYSCPYLHKGQRCAWYHPTEQDFISKRVISTLRCDIRHCRKGLFTGSAGSGIIDHCEDGYNAPIAPWAIAAEAVSVSTGSVSQKDYEAILDAMFPKLGETPQALRTVPNAKLKAATVPRPPSPPAAPPTRAIASTPKTINPATKPVCLFAVLGKWKCKNAREGKKCPFRHPEIPADKVTQEELEVARSQAIANRNRSAMKRQIESPMSKSKTVNVNKVVNAAKAPVQHGVHVASHTPKKASVVTPAVTTNIVDSISIENNDWRSVRSKGKKVARPARVSTAALLTRNAFDALSVDLAEQVSDTIDEIHTPAVVAEPCSYIAEVPSAPEPSSVLDTLKAQHAAELNLAMNLVSQFHDQGFSELSSPGQEITKRLSGSLILRALFCSGQACVSDHSWLSKERYGTLLSLVVADDSEAQRKVLCEVERYCRLHQFPLLESNQSQALLTHLFRGLFNTRIVEMSALLAWAEDGDAESDDESRRRALIQTASFLNYLKELELAIEEDEEECDWGTTASMKHQAPSVPEDVEDVKSSKELKKQRRLDRVLARTQ